MLESLRNYLSAGVTPGEAGSQLWATVYIVVIVLGVSLVVVAMTAFTTFLVVPFGRTHAVTDMNIGVLFMLGISSLGVLGIIMAGWSSNSHYPLMGSLRSSAQMVSYEIAMGLAIVSA